MKNIFIALILANLMSCHLPGKHTKKQPAEQAQNQGETRTDFIMEKLQRGIEFYATGNEPGWSLEMDIDKGCQFKTMDGSIFNTPVLTGVVDADGKSTRYHASMESGELNIAITRQECIDNMSGDKFTYSVMVSLKLGNDKEFKNYIGCGRWIFDHRLHDIWALESIDGKPIIVKEGISERPYIEFHTDKNQMIGKTSCNNFTGTVEFKGDKIIFFPLESSFKACPDAPFEAPFRNAISPGMVEYTIDNGRLSLYRNGKQSVVFRKVD
jgi:heat shock protein HslJ